MMNIAKSNKENLLEYILVFFAIALSNTVFFGLAHKTETSVIAFIYMIAFGVVRLMNNSGKVIIIKKNVLRLAVISFALLFSFLFMSGTADSAIRNFYIMVEFNILLAFFISTFLEKMSFVKIYINLMVIISVISLAHFVIALFFEKAVNYFTINSTEQGHYYSMFYTWGWENYGQGMVIFKRNSGPFWEPGAFQIFIVFAILFCIRYSYSVENPGSKLLILLITLFSTQSTTGLIILVLLILLYGNDIIDLISQNRFIHNVKNINKLIIFFAVVITVGWIIFSGVVSNKISYYTVSNSSANIRYIDLTKSLSLVSVNPLFGMGYGTDFTFNCETLVGIKNNSNGLFLMFYTMGIIFSFFYIIFEINGFFVLFKEKSIIKSVVVCGILLLMHMVECIFVFPICFLFFFAFRDMYLEEK